jgi:hypothetical protein
MTFNYTVTVSGTYYVIIDNPNWTPDLMPLTVYILSYEAVQNYPDSYYLSVKTDPAGIITIPGEGSYLRGHNTTLTASINVAISYVLQYRFDYWDVDGICYGKSVNPIVVCVYPNRTATAHYVLYKTLEHKDPFTFEATTRDTIPRALIGSDTGYSLTAGQVLFVTWSGEPWGWGERNTYSLRFYLLDSSQIGGWRWGPYYVLGVYVTQREETTSYLMKLDSWSMTASCPINATGTYYVILVCEGLYNPIDFQPAINVTSYDAYTLLSSRYYLSVKTDPLGITAITGEGWYNQGDNPVLTAPIIVTVSPGARYPFDYWDVDGTACNNGINPITVGMNSNHTATAHYVLQYQVSIMQSGLDSSATGTVVSVNSAPKTFSNLPYTFWRNNGSVVIYSYNSTVSSSTTGTRFALRNISNPISPIVVTGPITVTGYYEAQYQIAFNQTGLDNDFSGTIVTIDSIEYGYSALPTSFWWNSSSSHAFAFSTPLVVDASKQYNWVSTSGLTKLQGGTLTIATSGSVTAHYTVLTPFTVSIQPTSATIYLGQSVPFTSTIKGGIPPYGYQWHLDGDPVSGATSDKWVFTPSTTGVYYVYLKVTDSTNNTAQSETARVSVVTVPVGGYTILFNKHSSAGLLTPYLALSTMLTVFLVAVRRVRRSDFSNQRESVSMSRWCSFVYSGGLPTTNYRAQKTSLAHLSPENS